jgi:hypothetical protein
MGTAQTTYATDASGEIQVLSQLQVALELVGVLVHADALHSQTGRCLMNN